MQTRAGAEAFADRARAALTATKGYRPTDHDMVFERTRVGWWLQSGAKPLKLRYVEREIEWLEEIAAWIKRRQAAGALDWL